MRHHILLVEDDEDQRSGLADLLRLEGYAVTEAGNAEQALGFLQTDNFALMVTDYQLGGATGTWLARIAACGINPSSPRALLMTGHDQIADAGGMTVLKKPLNVERFLSEVKQAIAFPPDRHEDARAAAQRIAFILYVNDSLASRRTIKAVQALLERYDESQVVLTVVDLSKQTEHQAEEHRVVVLPTLLKTFPAPRVWIAGEFADRNLVQRMLEQAGVEARK